MVSRLLLPLAAALPSRGVWADAFLGALAQPGRTDWGSIATRWASTSPFPARLWIRPKQLWALQHPQCDHVSFMELSYATYILRVSNCYGHQYSCWWSPKRAPDGACTSQSGRKRDRKIGPQKVDRKVGLGIGTKSGGRGVDRKVVLTRDRKLAPNTDRKMAPFSCAGNIHV